MKARTTQQQIRTLIADGELQKAIDIFITFLGKQPETVDNQWVKDSLLSIRTRLEGWEKVGDPTQVGRIPQVLARNELIKELANLVDDYAWGHKRKGPLGKFLQGLFESPSAKSRRRGVELPLPSMRTVSPKSESLPEPSPPQEESLSGDAPQQLDKMISPSSRKNVGRILYQIPGQIPLGKFVRCTVRLAGEEVSTAMLSHGLNSEQEAPKVEPLMRTSEVMLVTLSEQSEESILTIKPLSNEKQVLLEGEYTEWLFDLKAESRGQTAVLLRVTARIIMGEFGEQSKDVVTLDRNIKVIITEGNEEEESFETFDVQTIWEKDHWQELLLAIGENRIEFIFEQLIAYVSIHQLMPLMDLILLQSRWNSNEGAKDKEVVLEHHYKVERNQILEALAGYIAQCQQEQAARIPN